MGRAHLTTAGSKAPAVFVFLELCFVRAIRGGIATFKARIGGPRFAVHDWLSPGPLKKIRWSELAAPKDRVKVFRQA